MKKTGLRYLSNGFLVFYLYNIIFTAIYAKYFYIDDAYIFVNSQTYAFIDDLEVPLLKMSNRLCDGCVWKVTLSLYIFTGLKTHLNAMYIEGIWLIPKISKPKAEAYGSKPGNSNMTIIIIKILEITAWAGNIFKYI